MKKPEITPGKWKLAKSCTVKASTDGKWMHFPEVVTKDFPHNPKPCICQITPREYRNNEKDACTPDAEAKANATAIAALPDLLEALERAVSIIEDLPHPENIPAQDLRQALTKAGYTFD